MPAALQQLQLVVATDQGCQGRAAPQRLEAALDPALRERAPHLHRCAKSLEANAAHIFVFKQGADQPPRRIGDDTAIWRRQSLQAGREVRCITNDRLLLSRTRAHQITHDRKPRGDSDSDFESLPFGAHGASGLN